MEPVVDRLEREYAGKVDFTIHVGTPDEEGERIRDQLGLRYVPTFVFVNTDGSVAKVDIGEIPEATMRERLDALR